MFQKVEHWSTKVSLVLSQWPAIEAVTLGDPLGKDVYDPHFFISLDAYYSGELPPPESRFEALSFGGGFDFSPFGKKDRFLVDNLPVRIEYVEKERVASRIEGKEGLFALLRENGTYPFYRILHSRLLFSRTEWYNEIRSKLEHMPPSFFSTLRVFFLTRLEHHYSDLEAASLREDPLLFAVASGNFIRALCSMIFAINQQFEPSLRILQEELKKLPVLPESD
ncbi:MAG: hypothetical protein SNJ78_00635, partial [Spirochaetales bacterium]